MKPPRYGISVVKRRRRNYPSSENISRPLTALVKAIQR